MWPSLTLASLLQSLGLGAVDVTNLLMGETDIIDTWITLSQGGSVHVLIGYEPHGIEPVVNDVVALEGFARHDGALVLKQDGPMKVSSGKIGLARSPQHINLWPRAHAGYSRSLLASLLPPPTYM